MGVIPKMGDNSMRGLSNGRLRRFQHQHGVENAYPRPFTPLVAGCSHILYPLHGVSLGIFAMLLDQQVGGAVGV